MLSLAITFMISTAVPGQIVFPAAPESAAPSPAVLAALEPVLGAIRQERATQAAMSPAADDRERLVRMGRLDQVGRVALSRLSNDGLTPAQAGEVRQRALGAMYEIDQHNQEALLAMAPTQGWFTRDLYGAEGSHAAFLIVQHGDLALWRRFLPVLEPLIGTGQITDADYALMFDRLAIEEGRPQRYGSQRTCRGRTSVLADLEDPDGVDQRRAAMGMSTLLENTTRLAAWNPCAMNPE